jgi:dipeptidyl aminopeptidase/acylaminoacyl peptidase
MTKYLLLAAFLYLMLPLAAQKKVLDHSVYDGWQSIGERLISNDGKFVVYTITPQEGDAELVVHNTANNETKKVARGYNAVITEDSRYMVCRIRPVFAENRQARIKKKRPDEMVKDSLAIVELGKDSVWRFARVKSYKTPEEGTGWVAWHKEKALPDTARKKPMPVDSSKLKKDMLVKMADSVIRRSVDSIKGRISKEDVLAAAQKAAQAILKNAAKDEAAAATDEDRPTDAEGDDPAAIAAAEGTDLVLKNLLTGKEMNFKYVSEYQFDKKGTRLLIETTKVSKDSNSKALVLVYHLGKGRTDTVMKGCNDCRGYAFDEAGEQLAFVAERDSSSKALQKLYKLWYHKPGQDTAIIIADKNTVGMRLGSTVSENGTLSFSKDGRQLYFGTAPIKPVKDTNLVEFEAARLDVWHYNDDYLQPVQLRRLDNELKRSHVAVTMPGSGRLVQLGDENLENITLVNEGNADWVLGETDKTGGRVQSQWEGKTRSTAYVVNTATGQRKLVAQGLYSNYSPSPAGKYVFWYDAEKRQYFTYEVASGQVRNVSAGIKTPLYDEENDVPDFPQPHGVMGWDENDGHLYVYDRYDAWKLRPNNSAAPQNIIDPTFQSRKKKIAFRYVRTDRKLRYINTAQPVYFRMFNETTKETGIAKSSIGVGSPTLTVHIMAKNIFNSFVKAQAADAFIYTKESYEQSPNLVYGSSTSPDRMISNINPQQAQYNWGTAELFKWKAYNGKETEGIVYKPEDFDPAKKYPLLCYFYETLSDGLYGYQAPAPTPSRLNIPFFVSRGYVVLAPDIHYGTGRPGKDAYDYIVSGARALIKQGYIDSNRTGLQGQSWGGYQVAHLITRTNLFKAAWAGAPVANMTSAYGGIRWESGLNRQFQYEHSQSRIGASLWDRRDLYIENSPLFHFNKCNTPVVVMANDNDGAVPWYQGIEMFTALRRLGKKVWMLNYNNEAHNLIERRNRKDIQIREQQFFDWLLKGEKPAKWLTDGVPATQKGIDWGLKTE